MYDNSLEKYEDGKQTSKGLITLDTKSQEIENKLRVDVNKFTDKWEYSYGVSSQFVKYNADSYNRLRKELRDDKGNIIQPEVAFKFNTTIDFFKFGLFGQIARKFLDEKLNFSAGIRSDMNSFTDDGMNPLKTISPRVAAGYSFAPKWRANASLGRYFKLPIYTILGFRDNAGTLVNKDNKYLQSDHFVSGLEFIPRPSTRFTLEGFYKKYKNYAVSARDGISLANLGGEYGAIGNEKITSDGKGEAYGVEFFAQQKLQKNLFAVFSYTLFWSQFSGKDGKLVSSAWDSRHLVAMQLGRKFKKGLELGLKYRFYGGAPYTPFALEASQKNYATLGVGLLDYSKINTLRLKNFSQVDFRIDKKINFRKQSFDFYLDIQNLLLAKNPSFPNYTFERTADNSGFATTDGKALNINGSNAKPLILSDATANVTPGFGLIWEF
jgi:outer membrane cobalamin receptor